MTPEITPGFAALAIEREHNAASRVVRDWIEEVIGLPFCGLPRRAALESLLLASKGRRREMLLDIIALGARDARSDWIRIQSMEDNWTSPDRSEVDAQSNHRREVA